MISDVDRATLGAIRSSVERAIRAAQSGALSESLEALARAEKRYEEVCGRAPSHARAVRQARDAIDCLRAALNAPKVPTEEDKLDGIRPRAFRLSTALRVAERIGT